MEAVSKRHGSTCAHMGSTAETLHSGGVQIAIQRASKQHSLAAVGSQPSWASDGIAARTSLCANLSFRNIKEERVVRLGGKEKEKWSCQCA
jgi:hypothetical protein